MDQYNGGNSRSSGNLSDAEFNDLVQLAARNPREAMRRTLGWTEDWGQYLLMSCNIAIAISYARFIELTPTERTTILTDSRWENYPPDISDPLFVALRMKLGAWRTKTASYERARVYKVAMLEAYQQGIEPHQVRLYLETNKLDYLYECAMSKPSYPDGAEPVQRSSDASEEHGGRILPDLTESDACGVPQPGVIEPGRQMPQGFRLPTPPHRSPLKSRAKTTSGKYAVDVSEMRDVSVLLSIDDFAAVIRDGGPHEFILHCRRLQNGGKPWVRIDGRLA